MAMVEVSIVPVGTETPSVSQYVARALEVLRDEKDIKYELTAMGTIIEGDLERLLALVRRMHESVFDAGVSRVVTTIKLDDRRDKVSSMSVKVESVKRKLGDR
ncbi:MTH1187 family thiamine-binding protein [Chloroflexota bacterium]